MDQTRYRTLQSLSVSELPLLCLIAVGTAWVLMGASTPTPVFVPQTLATSSGTVGSTLPALQGTAAATPPLIPTPTRVPSPTTAVGPAFIGTDPRPLIVVKEKRVKLPPAGIVRTLSPDGTRILLTFYSGQSRQVIPPTSLGALAESRAVFSTLATIKPDGSAWHRLNAVGQEPAGPAAFSPDGRFVAYLTYRNGETRTELHVVVSDGTKPRALGIVDGPFFWLQDRIAFVRQGQLWTVRSDGLRAQPAGGHWGVLGHHVRGCVLYLSIDPYLLGMCMERTRQRHYGVLSPNGVRLVYGTDEGLSVSDADGTHVQTLPQTLPQCAGSPNEVVWSLDSQWFAYSSTWCVSVASGDGTNVWLVHSVSHVQGLHWSDDSRLLAYTVTPSGTATVCAASIAIADRVTRTTGWAFGGSGPSGALIGWASRARKMLVLRESCEEGVDAGYWLLSLGPEKKTRKTHQDKEGNPPRKEANPAKGIGSGLAMPHP